MKVCRTILPLLFFNFLMVCPQTTGQRLEPRQLFLVNDNTAFIDSNGEVVINSSQPSLIDEVRRASPKLSGFSINEERQPWISFTDFSEGLAVIGWALCPMCRNNFWVNGFIDESARLVIPPFGPFTRFGNFHEGLARYSDHGWGFIDRNGLVVIPAKFYEARDFSEEFAVVRTSKTARFGYVSRVGELAIPYRFYWASDFHEGFAAVQFTKGSYGFIDNTGTVVCRRKAWLQVSDFSQGRAAVQVEIENNSIYHGYKERKYGFIDSAGKFVIAPRFDRVGNFSQGRALFGSGNGYGFIDSNGNVLIKPHFDNARNFSEGLAAVGVKSTDENEVWGYIDLEGHWIIRPQFRNVQSFSGGLAAVNCDQYGARCQAYIDRTGSVRWRKT